MKNLKLFSILTLVTSLVAISCSKNGATGPAGARGPAGPAGPDSVLYSNWTPLAMAINTDSTAYVQAITAPGITQDILDKGVVLSYMKFSDTAGAVNVVNASVYMDNIYVIGGIHLFSGTNYTGFNYRYIIIAGTIATGNSISSGPAKGYTKQQLQGMSYEDIIKLLGKSTNISPN